MSGKSKKNAKQKKDTQTTNEEVSTAKAIAATIPTIFQTRNIPRFTGSIITTLLSIGSNLALPWSLTEAVNLLSKDGSTYDIHFGKFTLKLTGPQMALIFSFFFTANQILPRSQLIFLTQPSKRAGTVSYIRTAEHSLNQSRAWNDDTPTGAKSQLGVESYFSLMDFSSQFMKLLPTTIEIAVYGSLLTAFYGWPLGLTTVGMLGASGVFNALTSKFITDANAKNLAAQYAFAGSGATILGNYETITQFGKQEHELKTLEEKSKELVDASTSSTTISEKLSIFQSLIIGVGVSLIIYLMARNVTKHKANMSDFIFIAFFLMQFVTPLSNFGEAINKLTASTVNLKKVASFWNKKPTVEDTYPDVPLKVDYEDATISFENVTFSYDKSAPVLNNISFKIPAGKKVGIVGKSGAGKSTIAKLLVRDYDLDIGQIKINGQNITQVGLNSLRAAIGTVPQKPTVFNESLEYNMKYGCKYLGKPELETREDKLLFQNLIEAFGLKDFIDQLPQGLQTTVGENGAKISGGQLQRLAGIRTILKKPHILILDEATSALDVQTETKVQSTFDAVSNGTTTLVITHHLPTVVNADHILVLDEGKIIEEGTHDELLAQDGHYAAMWREQADKYDPSSIFDRSQHTDNVTLQALRQSKKQRHIADPTKTGVFARSTRQTLTINEGNTMDMEIDRFGGGDTSNDESPLLMPEDRYDVAYDYSDDDEEAMSTTREDKRTSNCTIS